MLRILVVDPDPETVPGIERLFGERHATRLELCGCADFASAHKQFAMRRPTAVLIASSLLALDDEGRLRRQLRTFAPVPVVVLAEPEHARACGRAVAAGAQDWVPKDAPVFLALARIVAYAIERAQSQLLLERLDRTARTTEQLLVDVLESASTAALVLDTDGRIERCNGAAERLLYRARSRIEGRNFADFVLRYSLPAFSDALQLAAATPGRNVIEEIRLATGDESEDVRLELRACALDEARRAYVVWLKPVVAGQEIEEDPESHLRRVLQDVVASGRSRVPIAQVHLLGLGQVREALGDRWPELEYRVHRVVERVLEKFLSTEERWCRNGEQGYIVVFARASVEEAAERAARIAEAIEAAVLGAGDLAERARALVPPVSEEQCTRLARVTAECREADVDELGRGRMPIAADGERTRSAAVDPIAELEAEIRERAQVELEATYDRSGLPDPVTLGRPDAAMAEPLRRLLALAADEPRARLVHDLCLLDACLAALEREPELDRVVLLAEVHYETLAVRRFAEPWLERLRQVDPALRASLGVLLVGVPPGTYAPRLGRAVSLLRGLAATRAITVADPVGEPPDPTVVKADLLAVDHRLSEKAIDSAPDAFRSFVRRVHTLQGRVLLRRVPRGLAPLMRERFGVDLTCHA